MHGETGEDSRHVYAIPTTMPNPDLMQDKRDSTKLSRSKASCVKPCAIRQEERMRNRVWFGVKRLGGVFVLHLKMSVTADSPQAVLHLPCFNPMIPSGLPQKAEMFGGAVRHDRGVGCGYAFGCACAGVVQYV
jgi:hypothetical protein